MFGGTSVPAPQPLPFHPTMAPPSTAGWAVAATANATAAFVTINCTGKKAITDLLITRVMFLFAYALIFTTSICGNCLVVYVVLTAKGMQTVTNIFITNLAVSDLLVSCTSLWLTPVYTYVGHWVWGGWLCYGLPLFQGTSIFISTLTLMSIAVDRYLVICHHSKNVVNINERMSMQVCVAIITLIWMVSLLLVMPYAVHMRMAYVQQPCDFWLCIEDWAMEDLKSLYGIIVVSLQFVVPFAIIGHSYIRIWRFLDSRQRRRRKSEGGRQRSLLSADRSADAAARSEHETQRKKRLLRMLVTMVVLFAICWFPFNLLMATTACNPILYAWMNHAFRDEFLRVVPCLSAVCGARQQRRCSVMVRDAERNGAPQLPRRAHRAASVGSANMIAAMTTKAAANNHYRQGENSRRRSDVTDASTVSAMAPRKISLLQHLLQRNGFGSNRTSFKSNGRPVIRKNSSSGGATTTTNTIVNDNTVVEVNGSDGKEVKTTMNSDGRRRRSNHLMSSSRQYRQRSQSLSPINDNNKSAACVSLSDNSSNCEGTRRRWWPPSWWKKRNERWRGGDPAHWEVKSGAVTDSARHRNGTTTAINAERINSGDQIED